MRNSVIRSVMRWDRSCSRRLRSDLRNFLSDSSSDTANVELSPHNTAPTPRLEEDFTLTDEEETFVALVFLELNDSDDLHVGMATPVAAADAAAATTSEVDDEDVTC